MRLARPGDFDNGKEGITQDDGNVRVKIGCVSKASMAINLVTDKDKHAFITDCEKMIRTSLEYKQYIEYLKEYRGNGNLFTPNQTLEYGNIFKT